MSGIAITLHDTIVIQVPLIDNATRLLFALLCLSSHPFPHNYCMHVHILTHTHTHTHTYTQTHTHTIQTYNTYVTIDWGIIECTQDPIIITVLLTRGPHHYQPTHDHLHSSRSWQ